MNSKDRVKMLQTLVGANPDGVIGKETLSCFSKKYGRSRVETIHFFAQIHHETGGFTIDRENMNYSSKRLMEIFGVSKHSARITQQEAVRLAGKPYEIAERVYGVGNPSKARELGNTRPGDGWKFRGGGALHCTGGSNYKRYGGDELYTNPELISTEKYYFETALKEFDFRKIWSKATDLSLTSTRAVTRVVNGGYNGINDRVSKVSYYDSLYTIPDRPEVLPRLCKAQTLSNLNFRRGPSENYGVIRVLPKGTVVEVVLSGQSWTEVNIDGVKGHVASRYLKTV